MLQDRETITKRKDGRFMGRFIIDHEPNGKPVYQYVYGKSYDEAEQKLRIAREIESNYLSGRCITIKKVYGEWLNAIVNRVKESTYANYTMKFEKHILPYFGEMLCTSINSAAINAFIKKKVDSGLSAGYVRDLFTVFKALLAYAQEEYSFKLSLKNVSLPKAEKKKPHKMDDEQQKKLVGFIKSHIDLTGLGVLLSLFMGLRIGELCGLKWGDIDITHKILCVNRTVQRICKKNGSRKTMLVITEPKSTNSKRSIAIPDFLIPYLMKFRGNADDFILSGSEKVVEPRTMQYRYKKLLEAAAVECSNYHQLRHTFATNCVENGYDAKTLSIVLGHSTIALTLDRYVHPNRQYERRMMNSLAVRM